MSEPVCPSIFDFDFEKQTMHEAEVRRQMYEEVQIFKPADGSALPPPSEAKAAHAGEGKAGAAGGGGGEKKSGGGAK